MFNTYRMLSLDLEKVQMVIVTPPQARTTQQKTCPQQNV